MDKGTRALLTFRAANLPLLPSSGATDTLAPLHPLNSSIATHEFHYIQDTPQPLDLHIPDTDELAKINYIAHHNLFQQQINAVLTRSDEHTSELQSLMRNSYAVFCLKKTKKHTK